MAIEVAAASAASRCGAGQHSVHLICCARGRSSARPLRPHCFAGCCAAFELVVHCCVGTEPSHSLAGAPRCECLAGSASVQSAQKKCAS